MLQPSDTVFPGDFFPFDSDQFGLHRNCEGHVVSVSAGTITVDWNPKGKPQLGRYRPDQLRKK